MRDYFFFFSKISSLRNKAKENAILHKTMFLIFGNKLLFYFDIQLSFLQNLHKSLKEFFIKDIFKKCLEMENNQLKCGDYFYFISDARGDNDKNINYEEVVHLTFPPIFSVQVKSGACYITAQ